MSPVKRRRRLPTLINRGLGLLEVIMPRGSSDCEESCLPPGQRDTSGFWFPEGYGKPGEIFTPEQRKLQATQRAIQRRRHRPPAPPLRPPGGDGTMTLQESSGAANPPLRRAMDLRSNPSPLVPPLEPPEVAVPLPPPLPEATAISAGTMRRPETSRRRPPAETRVVDSPEGSD
jgi:hypothetical protein